ncbi:MAG TPA: TrmH family RNA methyltransferase [Candidatus Saccharimonadales bacterium]|nr:TrmH family RNA methyltransferase [Candidatus Saccharimonadales bacterium]
MSEIVVIAHNIRSSHNIGAIFRTCEGLGVGKLILSGYSPYPKKPNDKRLPHLIARAERGINKTALGAQNSLKWERSGNVLTTIAKLKLKGYAIAALEQSEQSIELSEYKPAGKIALILGNEIEGMDKEILDISDVVVEIAMKGKKESFNVSIAAAMCLYKLTSIK